MAPRHSANARASNDIDLDDPCPETLVLDSESEDDAVSVCVGPSSPQPEYWECMLSEPEGDSYSDVEAR